MGFWRYQRLRIEASFQPHVGYHFAFERQVIRGWDLCAGHLVGHDGIEAMAPFGYVWSRELAQGAHQLCTIEGKVISQYVGLEWLEGGSKRKGTQTDLFRGEAMDEKETIA